VDLALAEGHLPVIGIRDTPLDENNPYSAEERIAQWQRLYGDKVRFFTIPEDGEGLELWYGRGVGWGIREIEVPANVARVSGTELRLLARSTIWFTGLPCSGKTTLADAFADMLKHSGFGVKRLDGDVVREGLCAGLGFAPEGRRENLRRIAHVAKMFNDEGITVLASFVSPSEELRSVVREIIGPEQFRLVFASCPAEVCAKRDVKGMWAKAKAGEIQGFTGYDEPFEDPHDVELTIDTAVVSETESVEALCSHFGV